MYYAISMYLADDAGRNGNISHNASLHFSAGLVKFSAYPPPSPVIHPFILDDPMGQLSHMLPNKCVLAYTG